MRINYYTMTKQVQRIQHAFNLFMLQRFISITVIGKRYDTE